MKTLSEGSKVSIQTLKSADNEALTGATLDTLGYGSVMFIVGALQGEALDFTIKAQQGAVSDLSDAADLLGTSVEFSTGASADGLTVLDIKNVQERYVRSVVAVPDAASATPTFCIALLYNPAVMPVSNDGEQHVAPAEGTA